MKHVAPNEVTHEVRAKGPTRRALAKQQTHAKVLAAARKLFSANGYQGATIRDIAAAAGMSTGAVFANFSDKSDLFREIIATDMEKLAAEMREAAARGKTIEDVLLRMFMAGYAFYRPQMPLARAVFVCSWADEEGEKLRKMPQNALMTDLIAEQLNAAVERGELRQEAEVKLRAQMLADAYLGNYQPAIFEDWTLDALQARARDQIRILLGGARKG
jgi:AcrR family transcriptional regulator